MTPEEQRFKQFTCAKLHAHVTKFLKLPTGKHIQKF
jgi:hypothetical protein